MESKSFGVTKNGENTKLYTYRNNNGMEMSVSDFGATLVSLKVPDKSGQLGISCITWKRMTGKTTCIVDRTGIVSGYGR